MATASIPKANGVGALVNQLLEQVQSGASESASGIRKNVQLVQQTNVTFNGKQYESIDQLPPELKQVVNRGLSLASQLGNQREWHVATSVEVAPTENQPAGRDRGHATKARWIIAGCVAFVIAVVISIVVVLLGQAP